MFNQMSRVGRFLVFWLPGILYASLIFHLSSGPVSIDALEDVPDYYVHTVEYCLFYIAMFWAIHEGFEPLDGRGNYWFPAVLTVLYGISDEYHQSFVQARDASMFDVLADSFGAGAGIVATLAFNRLISFFRPKGVA